MRKMHAKAGVLLAATAAHAQDILVFQADTNHHLVPALGLVTIFPDRVITDDFPALTVALSDPGIAYAFISNPCCRFDAGTPAALADFLGRGNYAHMNFWNMDGEPLLADLFAIESAVDFVVPREVHDNIRHPSWRFTPSPVVPRPTSPWSLNGSEVTAAPGATIAGTFDSTSGAGAIVAADDGHTLFNAFTYDAMDPDDIRALLGAQAEWLLGFGPVCYPDWDEDGQLTIFDFLAFQNAFDTGDLRADCDQDGVLTLFDFLCFQNAFDAGCP